MVISHRKYVGSGTSNYPLIVGGIPGSFGHTWILRKSYGEILLEKKSLSDSLLLPLLVQQHWQPIGVSSLGKF